MDFVRRHAFFFACGAVGLAAVAVAVWGVLWMGRIDRQLESVRRLSQDLQRYWRPPDQPVINDKAVEAVAAKIRQIMQDYEQVLAMSHEMNRREPLLDDVFPTPADGAAPWRFRSTYLQARQELPIRMDAGLPADQQDIEIQKQLIQTELEAEQAERVGMAAEPSGAGGPGTESVRPTALAAPEGGQTPAYLTEAAGVARRTYEPRFDPVIRAVLAKARSVRCYYRGLAETFGQPPFEVVGAKPDAEQMWRAQLSLWIQQDVVDAIGRINEQAARVIEAANQNKPPAERESAWVGNMPVKALLHVDVGEYVLGEAETGRAGSRRPGAYVAGAGGSGQQGPSFTRCTCNDLYDVVRFQVRMIVDSRDLLRVIDGLCAGKFFVPVCVNYEKVEYDPRESGMFYGEEPLLDVTVDFEAYFFTDIYRPLMPKAVKERLLQGGGPERGRASVRPRSLRPAVGLGRGRYGSGS